MILLRGTGEPVNVLSRAHCESQGRLQVRIERAAWAIPHKIPVIALYGGPKQDLPNNVGQNGADVVHENPQNETR